jgi:hypothetical protein
MIEQRLQPLQLNQQNNQSKLKFLTFGEEIGIPIYELARHSCSRQSPQSFSLVALTRIDRNLVYLIDCHSRSFSQTFNYDL